ncbi:MAG: hypothetical protein M1431_04195 [Candidatus Thermoplasmatota archaeon]|nr:hypothetical protein [Candidatus Thermoplasmatota archaeon]
MNNYTGTLLSAMENLLYRDRGRDSLKSTDFDVLRIFSGDEEAAIRGLKDLHLKHQDKSVLIHNGNCLELKTFSLFKDPDQENQKINWKKNHRWKDGKFPQGRPYRRDNSWKR